MSSEKLRILCFHGYRQNGVVFRQKTGALRKAFKRYADFEFVTSPHPVPQIEKPNDPGSTNEEDEINSDQHGWWFTTEDRTYSSAVFSEVCVGFEESLTCVEKALQEKGPFDGIMGFSQGASFVSILCSLQERNRLKGAFKFAILVSGFKSRCIAHREHYETTVSVPSLHIYGETDKVIPREMSEDLSTMFSNAKIVVHPGGHFIAAAGNVKQEYKAFLEDQILEKTKQNK